MRNKPLPLRSEILSQQLLQVEILTLIERVRKQLNRAGWEDGMTDQEFITRVLDPLKTKIENDQYMQRMYKNG